MTLVNRIKELIGFPVLTEEEIEESVLANQKHLYSIRPPEVPGFFRDFLKGVAEYLEKHPELSYAAACSAFREANKELWPHTMSQEPEEEYLH